MVGKLQIKGKGRHRDKGRADTDKRIGQTQRQGNEKKNTYSEIQIGEKL